jgi:hypothetical protein
MMRRNDQRDPTDRLKRLPRGFDDSDRVWGRIVQRDEWAFTLGRVELVDDSRHGPSIRYDVQPVDRDRYRQRRPDVELVESDGRQLIEEVFDVVEGFRDDREGFVAERGPNVLTFARRRGPLRLCARHGAPLGHGHDDDRDDPRCLFGGLEPLSIWWGVGRRALAIRDLAVAVHRGGYGEPSDWAALGFERGHGGRPAREQLASAVNLALASAAPRPALRWGGGAPEFRPFTSLNAPVYAAIVVQLALVVARVGGLAVCSICGRPFPIMDRERRPRSDRRAYCSQPCRKLGRALNARAYRERQR